MNLYPWHKKLWDDFLKKIKSNYLPHAFLLSGQKGMGKHVFSDLMVSLLFCENDLENKSCNICRSCILWKAKTHPDYFLLSPLEDEKNIKVERIRYLIEAVSKKAHNKGYKIIVIEADFLNRASSNALLKSIEEPPEKTIFILIQDKINTLIPTLKSRCQSINFLPSFEEKTLDWLQEQEKDSPRQELRFLLNFAEGAPLSALDYSRDKELFTIYGIFLKTVSFFNEVKDPIDTAKTLSTLDTAKLIVWYQYYFHDLMKVKLETSDGFIFHQNYLTELKNQEKEFSLSHLRFCLDLINQFSKKYSTYPNLNYHLQWENFLIEIGNLC